MSAFDNIRVDLIAAASELVTFKIWLAGVTFVDEASIVAQIKARR